MRFAGLSGGSGASSGGISSLAMQYKGGLSNYSSHTPNNDDIVGHRCPYMKRLPVVAGAVIAALSVLMPVSFIAFRFLPFGVLEGLSLGIDIFCCCGASFPLFIVGAGLVTFGLISTDVDRKAR